MPRVLLGFALAFSLGNPAALSWAEALFELVLPTADEVGGLWEPDGAASESDAGNKWDPDG